jgi:glycine/D-amino acid oxidase-like deaminating enzyme
MTPSRQVALYLTPPADLAESWSRSPMILDIDGAHGFYGVPPIPGTGLKIGDHRFSLTGDPDTDRDGGEREGRAIFESCKMRLRHAEGYHLDEVKTCFYSVTPDERFIADPVGKAIVVSACSGHGFKFGALFGQALAEVLDGRRSPEALAGLMAGAAL